MCDLIENKKKEYWKKEKKQKRELKQVSNSFHCRRILDIR